MAISALAKKLQIKPGMKVALVNVPAEVAAMLRPLPDGATISGSTTADGVIAFAKDDAELRKIAPHAVKALRADGLLWLAYPKGSAKMKTDLNRDVLRETIAERHSLEGVSLVAVDGTWSAMRFRPKGAGKGTR